MEKRAEGSPKNRENESDRQEEKASPKRVRKRHRYREVRARCRERENDSEMKRERYKKRGKVRERLREMEKKEEKRERGKEEEKERVGKSHQEYVMAWTKDKESCEAKQTWSEDLPPRKQCSSSNLVHLSANAKWGEDAKRKGKERKNCTDTKHAHTATETVAAAQILVCRSDSSTD